jgi:hypothetical protein
MEKGGIFDEYGFIRPLRAYQMDIIPKAHLVNYYGRMYTNTLVLEAKAGTIDFELFMELHRQAAWRQIRGKLRYEWDNNTAYAAYTNTNALFLRDYDKKWSIFMRDGCTYKLEPVRRTPSRPPSLVDD